jgi:hypothetical protein
MQVQLKKMLHELPLIHSQVLNVSLAPKGRE